MWNLKTNQPPWAENRLVADRDGGWGVGKMHEGSLKVQISPYKTIKSGGCNVQHNNYYVVYLKVLITRKKF